MVNAVKVFTLRLCISAYYIHFKRVKVKIFTAFTITALNNRIVEFDKQLSLYQDMHNDALTLESNHTLTAELIDRLIERIEVNHDKELTIVFRFQTDYAKVVTE